MASLKQLIAQAQATIAERQQRVAAQPEDAAFSKSVWRLCSLGALHDPTGVRGLVGRIDAETLTDEDQMFLAGFPPMQDTTPEELARLIIKLDDEV